MKIMISVTSFKYWAMIALLPLVVIASGCGSAAGISSQESNALASTTVLASSLDSIHEAVSGVFVSEGFKVLSEKPERIVMQKKGDRSTQFLYGTTWEDTAVLMVEPRIEIVPLGYSRYRLDCDVYIVEIAQHGRSAPWRVVRNGKRQYQKLMDRVRESVEAPAVNHRQLTP